jgi:hypothetical protein
MWKNSQSPCWKERRIDVGLCLFLDAHFRLWSWTRMSGMRSWWCWWTCGVCPRESSSMLRQAQSQGVKDPSARTMVRVLWFAGYLTIALGALLPTFLLPEPWSILHSGHRYLLDVPIMLPKVLSLNVNLSPLPK